MLIRFFILLFVVNIESNVSRSSGNWRINNKGLVLNLSTRMRMKLHFLRMIVFIDTLLTWFFNIYKARQKVSLFTHIILVPALFWTHKAERYIGIWTSAVLCSILLTCVNYGFPIEGWKKSYQCVNNSNSAERRAVWSKITGMISGGLFSKVWIFFFFFAQKAIMNYKTAFCLFSRWYIKITKAKWYWSLLTYISLFISNRGNYERVWRKSRSIKRKLASIRGLFFGVSIASPKHSG